MINAAISPPDFTLIYREKVVKADTETDFWEYLVSEFLVDCGFESFCWFYIEESRFYPDGILERMRVRFRGRKDREWRMENKVRILFAVELLLKMA